MSFKDSGRFRKRLLWSPLELNGLITKAVDEGGSTSHTEGALLTAPKDTAVDLIEVSDYGMVGINFSAASKVAHFSKMCPYDLDIKHPVYYRIHFTQSGAVSTGVTWILKAGADKANAVIQAEDAAGIAALDIPLVEKNAGGLAFEHLVTAWGKDNYVGLTRDEVEAGALLRYSLEADIVDTGIANIAFLGLEIGYTPIHFIGVGSEIEAPDGSSISNI